jgi:hypothetical protein
MPSNNYVTTVFLPRKALARIDALVEKGYYQSRSDYLRQLVQTHLVKVTAGHSGGWRYCHCGAHFKSVRAYNMHVTMASHTIAEARA